MFPLPHHPWKRSALLVGCVLLGLAPLVYAQSPFGEEVPAPAPGTKPEKNTRSEAERRAWRAQQQQQLQGGNQLILTCMLARPGQVHRFAITCPATRHVDVRVADCCMNGDRWYARAKVWDPKPNEGMATSPGGAGAWSAPARTFSYSQSRDLHVMVECGYLHGTAAFPAEADIMLESSAPNCTVEDLGTATQM